MDWALFIQLTLQDLVLICVGMVIGKWYEARRWRKVAKHLTWAAPAHKQSLWSRGIEFVVLTMDDFRRLK